MTDPRQQLRRVAEERNRLLLEASAQIEGANLGLLKAVKNAQSAGIPMTEIAELCGMSRARLYQLMEKER